MTELHIFDYLGRPPLPPVSEQDIANARQNPGNWFYYIDPEVSKDGPISPENVMSGRKADDAGNVTDEYWVNPDFIPKPRTAGMTFANAFELVFWRTLEGYCDIAHFLYGLSRAELITVATSERPGMVPLHYENDGEYVLRAYTSAQFLPRDTNPWLRIPISGMYILEQICPEENSIIHFNPDGGPSFGLSGPKMATWWEEFKTVDAKLRAEYENRAEHDNGEQSP